MVGEAATMSNPSSAETLNARIATALKTVRQPRPKLVRPIVVIGAGGIVRAAHLPAYEKAGFPVNNSARTRSLTMFTTSAPSCVGST